MVGRLEDEILPLAIGKPFSQIDYGFFELFWHEHFVGQSGKGKVKVVAELGGFEVFGLYDRRSSERMFRRRKQRGRRTLERPSQIFSIS